jgi:hypothetical protein
MRRRRRPRPDHRLRAIALRRPVPASHGPETVLALLGARARHAQCPSGAGARDQLALQRAAALNEQRLVDGLVADPHRLIIGEIDPEAVRDLLRAPRL